MSKLCASQPYCLSLTLTIMTAKIYAIIVNSNVLIGRWELVAVS